MQMEEYLNLLCEIAKMTQLVACSSYVQTQFVLYQHSGNAAQNPAAFIPLPDMLTS